MHRTTTAAEATADSGGCAIRIAPFGGERFVAQTMRGLDANLLHVACATLMSFALTYPSRSMPVGVGYAGATAWVGEIHTIRNDSPASLRLTVFSARDL
eukprot:957562-Amphidinium_carterae.1